MKEIGRGDTGGNTYEKWLIKDKDSDLSDVLRWNILAFRPDKEQKELIIMSELQKRMPNGLPENFTMIQYKNTSYKFKELTDFDNFDVDNDNSLAYFHNSKISDKPDTPLRIYIINFSSTTSKTQECQTQIGFPNIKRKSFLQNSCGGLETRDQPEWQVFTVKDGNNQELLPPEFGRLMTLQNTAKIVFMGEGKDNSKYICLYGIEMDTKTRSNGQPNCIKLKNTPQPETFLYYRRKDDEHSNVLFCKKADERTITLQVIDFEDVNEISYNITNGNSLNNSFSLIDGYYYKYDQSKQVGFFYFFACFDKRLVFYKILGVQNTLRIDDETFQLNLKKALTKVIFIKCIKDGNEEKVYSLFSYLDTNEKDEIQEYTYLTLYNIQKKITLAYQVLTESNNFPLFINGTTLYSALKDNNCSTEKGSPCYIKSTVNLKSANIAIGINYKPKFTSLWELEENVTLTINLSEKYEIVAGFSAQPGEITPEFSTYIDQGIDTSNVYEDLTLEPRIIDINNGNEFNVTVTPRLNDTDNVLLCINKTSEAECTKYFKCNYNNTKQIENLHCTPQKAFETTQEFRAYVNTTYEIEDYSKKHYYHPVLISQNQCTHGCKICNENITDNNIKNKTDIGKCKICSGDKGFVLYNKSECIAIFHYFIKYSHYVLTPVLCVLWALSWKQEQGLQRREWCKGWKL
ncbi:unnamed protein product [Moneuplotes crassus]|uniref:Uncharacterized protein n=1 Tax=Euplotes crassus TaxID=5936 RepID=A0AAD1XPA3_EUPCR|nr:unnamed protein product [Moneuplotes crassus]